MGVLQRFERRLEGLVNGAFARAFRAEVQPVEIAAALQRELDNTAQVLSRHRSLVPNAFVVELSSSDYRRLSPHERTLSAELIELVRDHAETQHYSFSGPIQVAMEENDDLGTGSFRVRSEVRAGVAVAPSAVPSDTGIRRAVLQLEVNGTDHPVIAPGLVLGRSSECDLRIDDPGVSRRHAEIRVQGQGRDVSVVLVDLGSTNGTLVNGQRVQQAELVDGTQIVLGSTVVTVHRPRPRPDDRTVAGAPGWG